MILRHHGLASCIKFSKSNRGCSGVSYVDSMTLVQPLQKRPEMQATKEEYEAKQRVRAQILHLMMTITRSLPLLDSDDQRVLIGCFCWGLAEFRSWNLQ